MVLEIPQNVLEMSRKDLTSGTYTEDSELVASVSPGGLSPPWVHAAGLKSPGAAGTLLLG